MRGFVRAGGILLGFCSVVLGTVVLLDRFQITSPVLPAESAAALPLAIDTLRRVEGSSKKLVVVLGDSTAIVAPPGGRLPDRLQEAMDRQRPQGVVVHNLASYGMSPFEYYAFAERIAAMRPDLIVLGLNLQSFSSAWRDLWGRREFYGWIEPSRLGEAALLPLQTWGLTLDTLLFYKAIVAARLVQPWIAVRREQVRAGIGLDSLRSAMQGGVVPALSSRARGLPPTVRDADPYGRRYSRKQIEQAFAPALVSVRADHPLLVLLRREIATFRRSGIGVLVYTVPANVEHMRRMGITDLRGLQETTRTICAAAAGEGARCVDLHDVFPDDWFGDAGGHFTTTPGKDGMKRVADLLAAPVLESLQAPGAAHAVQ